MMLFRFSSTLRSNMGSHLFGSKLDGVTRALSAQPHFHGQPDSEAFRVFFKKEESVVSTWHDIPLQNSDSPDTFNFICEIPRMSKAKMEICTKEQGNPIKQDMKKGALRYYHGPIYWNYGALPQTWEDPEHLYKDLNLKGDGDPLDVVEIGSKALHLGSITQVKPLGILGLIDDGELDWKLIAINVDDELAQSLNDINDIEKVLPGTVSGIREWFRWYKTPDGKQLNKYAYDGEALNKCLASEKITDSCLICLSGSSIENNRRNTPDVATNV